MTGSTLADFARNRTPIQWDWPGWLPRGYLTLLVSPSGVGKSSLALRIAASYTAGLPWPDGTPFTTQRGPILWVEGEDSYEMHLDRGLDFGPPPQACPEELEGPPPRLSQQDRAAAFLQELLAGGPVPVRRIKAEGQAAGLSGPTLERAKKQLGIISRRSGKAWYWQLPVDSE